MDIFSAHDEHFVSLCGQVEDFPCEAVLAGVTGRGQVVKTTGNVAIKSEGSNLRDELGWCWRSNLISHDIELWFGLGQPQHSFHEVVAAGAVYPAGAKIEVFRAALLNRLVAVQFGLAVDTQRASCSGKPGLSRRAVSDSSSAASRTVQAAALAIRSGWWCSR